jgi:hypothetical protein
VLPGRRLLPEGGVLHPGREEGGEEVLLPHWSVLPRGAVLRGRRCEEGCEGVLLPGRGVLP